MKLLICTQAVDLDDSVLGFFHVWIEELAKHVEKISVICLKEGRHAVPSNVSVSSLGKESGQSRLKYVLRFYRYVFLLRNEYDAVFVHMNQEYVLLGGFFWRLWGKKIVLWRNHAKGTFCTRIAGSLAHKICYTSPSAYVSSFENAEQMPIGIDTDAFRPSGSPVPGSILFLGRLDPVKRPDVFCEAVSILSRQGVPVQADIYGDPTPARVADAEKLKSRYKDLPQICFHRAVRNRETPALYASHAVYVNITPSGSFDKTIGEAMASGCIVIAANNAVRNIVPPEHFIDIDADSVANAIKAALGLSPERRALVARSCREWIIREHSLSLLVSRLIEMIRR
ncbi:MAG TPA: glycosyltransferase family 4 protein [Candidatus Paceibacterota bacterium]